MKMGSTTTTTTTTENEMKFKKNGQFFFLTWKM